MSYPLISCSSYILFVLFIISIFTYTNTQITGHSVPREINPDFFNDVIDKYNGNIEGEVFLPKYKYINLSISQLHIEYINMEKLIVWLSLQPRLEEIQINYISIDDEILSKILFSIKNGSPLLKRISFNGISFLSKNKISEFLNNLIYELSNELRIVRFQNTRIYMNNQEIENLKEICGKSKFKIQFENIKFYNNEKYDEDLYDKDDGIDSIIYENSELYNKKDLSEKEIFLSLYSLYKESLIKGNIYKLFDEIVSNKSVLNLSNLNIKEIIKLINYLNSFSKIDSKQIIEINLSNTNYGNYDNPEADLYMLISYLSKKFKEVKVLNISKIKGFFGWKKFFDSKEKKEKGLFENLESINISDIVITNYGVIDFISSMKKSLKPIGNLKIIMNYESKISKNAHGEMVIANEILPDINIETNLILNKDFYYEYISIKQGVDKDNQVVSIGLPHTFEYMQFIDNPIREPQGISFYLESKLLYKYIYSNINWNQVLEIEAKDSLAFKYISEENFDKEYTTIDQQKEKTLYRDFSMLKRFVLSYKIIGNMRKESYFIYYIIRKYDRELLIQMSRLPEDILYINEEAINIIDNTYDDEKELDKSIQLDEVVVSKKNKTKIEVHELIIENEVKNLYMFLSMKFGDRVEFEVYYPNK